MEKLTEYEFNDETILVESLIYDRYSDKIKHLNLEELGKATL